MHKLVALSEATEGKHHTAFYESGIGDLYHNLTYKFAVADLDSSMDRV